jgi:L,D-transpeptidase YcbB
VKEAPTESDSYLTYKNKHMIFQKIIARENKSVLSKLNPKGRMKTPMMLATPKTPTALLSYLLLLAVALNCTAEPSPPTGNTVSAGIQSLIGEGVHPGLHWGKFPDYQAPLRQLYEGNGYQPLWTHNGKGTSQAKAMIASLATAYTRGLNNEDYDAELLGKWLVELDKETGVQPQTLASFDVALSLMSMRYASNVYVGRINPRHVNFGLDIEPKKLDLPALSKQLAAGNDPDAVITGLEPKLHLYKLLKNALRSFAGRTPSTSSPQINLPAKFSPGDRHPDVVKLRQILLDEKDDRHSEAYDDHLAERVKDFQHHNGLTPDGVIGKSTLAQLNISPAGKLKQIQLSMERLRWLPERLEGRYIIVNIPSFELFGFDANDEKPALVMNVIVGEAIDGRNTPVFHSDMTYLNFRPYWNVPYKIAAKEYLPKLLNNPGYLAHNNMELVSNLAPGSATYQASLDNIEMLASGEVKLRQKPGPKNALGLVKFAFPNNNNVYLHSTPTPGLFKKSRRDFSHGCIRVERPSDLAEYVLKEQSEWNLEKIEEAMNGDKTRTVTLKTPIPVYIFYATALAAENGEVRYFQDIYGHDQILQDLLARGFPYPP